MEDAAASGGYEQEEHAAEAYDVAALKVKGLKNPKLNYAIERCAVHARAAAPALSAAESRYTYTAESYTQEV
jgi:hypothetical protein